MNSLNLELENITNIEIDKLSNDELVEVYKLIKEYIEYLKQQKVKMDD